MCPGIKPFQVKHLFSEVLRNVNGVTVSPKHLKMLITLTPHTLLKAGKERWLRFIGAPCF